MSIICEFLTYSRRIELAHRNDYGRRSGGRLTAEIEAVKRINVRVSHRFEMRKLDRKARTITKSQAWKFASLCILVSFFVVELPSAARGQASISRIQFEDRHEPILELSQTASFVGKTWSGAEKEQILDILRKIEKASPGIIDRVILYRPLRLYRSEKGGPFEQIGTPFAYDAANGIVLRDGFFRLSPDDKKIQFLHELAHVADVGHRISFTKEWAHLVNETLKSVRQKITKLEAANSSPITIREKNQLARAHGFPSFYATTNAGEALAEFVAFQVFDPTFSAPNDIANFISAEMCLRHPLIKRKPLKRSTPAARQACPRILIPVLRPAPMLSKPIRHLPAHILLVPLSGKL